MLLGAILISVLLQEKNVLLEHRDNKLMRGEKRARQPPHFFPDEIQDLSFTAWMRGKYTGNSWLCGLVLKPHGGSTSGLMEFFWDLCESKDAHNFIELLNKTEVIFLLIFQSCLLSLDLYFLPGAVCQKQRWRAPVFTAQISKSLSHCYESQSVFFSPAMQQLTHSHGHLPVMPLLCKGGQPSPLQRRNGG